MTRSALRSIGATTVAIVGALAACRAAGSRAAPASPAVAAGPRPIALLLVIQSELFASRIESITPRTLQDRQPLLPLGAVLPSLRRLDGVAAVFAYGELAGPRTTFSPLSNIEHTWSAGLFDVDGEVAVGLAGALAFVPVLMRDVPADARRIAVVVGDGCDAQAAADPRLPETFAMLSAARVELLEIRTASSSDRACGVLAGHATRLGADLATGLAQLPSALQR